MEIETMMNPDRMLLERNKLFRDVNLDSVEHLLSACQVVDLKKGETLLEIGQKNALLYLVLDGELHIHLNGRGLPVHASLGLGECVGELSMIDGAETVALVVAARDTRTLQVPHEVVWSMMDIASGIARNLLAILAGRIRNDILLQVSTPEPSLEFEMAANIDMATGLHNKNWIDDAFQRMSMRCEKNGTPFYLLVADIDRFKEYNDSHGHLAGDNALKEVARIIAKNLRPHDLLAYLGAGRFAVLLPERLPEGAQKTAERLREAVASPVVPIDKYNALQAATHVHERFTVSLGYAAVLPGNTLNKVLESAEEALLEAIMDARCRVKSSLSLS
jgi:diguanylate cyclase (GGDEF)-like protein